MYIFFFKQKTAYEMRISDWSADVCSSDLVDLDSAGRISALGQEVRACALGQASAALMGASAIGRSGAEIAAARDALRAYLAGEGETPGDWPGLDVFAPARAHHARHASILLAFEAAAEEIGRAHV